VLQAHAWPLVRDRERLAAVAARLTECPLGSGAVAGSGILVDREALALALGFQRPSANALDVTGDRDFVVDALAALVLLGTHVSRLAGELMAYTSAEVGFVRLDDAFCTGSSLLPQKRNPDVFELARAKASRLLGDLTALLATLRGLPAGYSKDLQEDKAWLFDAVDTVLLTLPAVRGAVATLTPRGDRMRAALDAGLLATDIADGLVREGVPFREAHGLVGRLVRVAEEAGVPLDAVPADRAATVHPRLPALLRDLGTWEDSIERRATLGGSSRHAVARQQEALGAAFARPWSGAQ
jgi:argininosuccinate lyase